MNEIKLIMQPCSMSESERGARLDRAWDLINAIYRRVQKQTESARDLGGRGALPAGAIQTDSPDAEASAFGMVAAEEHLFAARLGSADSRIRRHHEAACDSPG